MSQIRFFSFIKNWLASPYFLALFLLAFALLLYFPALFVPFWGDDYAFLHQARASRLNDESWWLPFHTQSQLVFWRPLGMVTYFRWVETYLEANVVWAHMANFVLWVLASACVGFFARTLASAMKWAQPTVLGLLAAGVYAINGAHFLPVHWVAAVNSSILVIWTALALGFWVLAPQLNFSARVFICILLPILQLLALLSKESAILIPFLFLTLSGFCWRQLKISALEVFAWVACVLVCGIWLFFYQKFSGRHPDVYGLEIGTNILRNLLSLLSWLLNIPREALRMILNGDELLGIAWAASVAVPMVGFIYLSVVNTRFHSFQWLPLLFFIGFAYAPYFLLAEQSYEYYAAVALIFPAILVSYGVLLSKRKVFAVLLLMVSSTLAVGISRHLEYPALMGRTAWAERQLQRLEKREIMPNPLVIDINNYHRFYAIGVSGLSWRLGVPEKDIYIAKECIPGPKEMLVEDMTTGNLIWKECGLETNLIP